MNISVKGEYALEAILDLASQKPGEPVRIAEIARRQKIPQKFLELILAGLKQGGFVEGPQHGKKNTRRKHETPFTEVWQQVDRAVSDILDRTTFADLQRSWADKQNKFVLNWEI